MRIVVVMNRKSGPPSADGKARADERIRALFAEHGIDADVRAVRGDHIAREAQKAVANGVDAVVAAGGDGTVGTVAGILAGTGVALGVLPLGTLNHFAKDAGIPLALEEAVAAVVSGEARPVDVAEVNGRVFVNNSSVGLYAAAVKLRDAALQKSRMGKWWNMFRAGFRVFRRFPLLRVHLETDEETAHRCTPLVFIGNNEYEMELFSVGKRSCLDSGKLCVYYADCTSRWCLIRMALRAAVGTLPKDKAFGTLGGEHLWIEHRRRSLHVSLDGEVVRLRPPLHYRTRPGALRLLMPARKEVEATLDTAPPLAQEARN